MPNLAASLLALLRSRNMALVVPAKGTGSALLNNRLILLRTLLGMFLCCLAARLAASA